MKKIIFILILVVLFSVIFFKNHSEERLTIEYLKKGEEIRVLNENEEVVMDYKIEEFRSWAKENWGNLFEIPPSFGDLREVDPDNFYVFENSAAISPEFNFLAFSVSDYAALTDISFLGIIDLQNNEVDLIRDYNIGGVQSIAWAPNEQYLAYILDTARAGGDYLTLDNVSEKKKIFTLSAKDLVKEEQNMNDDFFPEFRKLKWEDSSQRIFFATNSDNNEKEEVLWSIDINGKNLRMEQ